MTDHRLSRRDFITTAMTAAAAAGTLASAVAQDVNEQTIDKRVRIGVVGGGFGAGFHWHEDPNCEVAAVSDLIPNRLQNLQNRYGCEKTYPSLEEMIRDDTIDAIAVFTGATDHVRHDIAVMNSGKHCISAVPAGVTLEECAMLIEAKERTGMKYMMAETSYYRNSTITMRRMVDDGSFGEILYSEGEYYHPSIGTSSSDLSRWPEKGPDARTWRWGFPPMMYPTHSTGFLVGASRERLVEVSCIGTGSPEEAFQDNAYNSPFCNESALFKTDRGNMFRCNVMWNMWAHGERAQWFGDKMALLMPGWAGQPYAIRGADGTNIAARADYAHLLPEKMRYDSGHGGSHSFISHEFISAIAEDREPAVDVYEAVAMTAPGLVAHESSFRGGEQLRVPNFDPA